MAEHARGDECPMITVTADPTDKKPLLPPLNQGTRLQPNHYNDSQGSASRPSTSSSSISNSPRYIGSPPPSALRRQQQQSQHHHIHHHLAMTPKRCPSTPTPGQECPIRINVPLSSPEHGPPSPRGRLQSCDGFGEVTLLQVVTSPTIRAMSAAANNNNNSLTPPPRVIGVAADSTGNLTYVQELTAEAVTHWRQVTEERRMSGSLPADEDETKPGSSGSGCPIANRSREPRVSSIAELVSIHKQREDDIKSQPPVVPRPSSVLSPAATHYKAKVYRLKPLTPDSDS